jgi:hypothetical protein
MLSKVASPLLCKMPLGSASLGDDPGKRIGLRPLRRRSPCFGNRAPLPVIDMAEDHQLSVAIERGAERSSAISEYCFAHVPSTLMQLDGRQMRNSRLLSLNKLRSGALSECLRTVVNRATLVRLVEKRMGMPMRTVVSGVAVRIAKPLSSTAGANLEKWLKMIVQGDFLDLPSIIATDAVYHSPVEWHPYPGRDLVCLLVRTAAGVLEDFKYQRQFVSGDDAALEFSAHVGDIELKGVHILRFNDAGEIVDIDLVARPTKGVIALGNGVGSKVGPQIKAALDAVKSAPNLG